MAEGEAPRVEGSPRDRYRRRRREIAARLERLDARDERLANLRLLVFLIGLALAWPTLASGTLPAGLLLLPVSLFAGLAVYHARLAREVARQRLLAAWYERAFERLDGRWSGTGVQGVGVQGVGEPPTDHSYAADLDLFGPASLYELLCTARTLPGRRKLADWLLTPASAEEVRERQGAVEELRERLDLREEVALLGREVAPTIEASDLSAWVEAPRRLAGRSLPWIAAVLGAATSGTLFFWLFGDLERRWAMLAIAAAGLFVLRHRHEIGATLAGAARSVEELRQLAGLVALIEVQEFRSPRLRELQRSRLGLRAEGGAPASREIARLAHLLQWNDSRRNFVFQPLAGALLLGTQLACALERWRRRAGPHVGAWFDAVGEIEALNALATFAFENPGATYPQLADDGPELAARELAHPLLPRDRRVANDLRLDAETRMLLVTGSNMAGKSTLLRTVGVNVVLAQMGAPVCARELRLSPLRVGASLRVQDSLAAGESRFYAGLRRLRQICDFEDRPPLFLLDEILQGTNSHDRRVGARAVVVELLDRGGIGLVTTHDLTLAEELGKLELPMALAHLRDELVDGKLTFDYRLRPGLVEHGNALELMRHLGLPVDRDEAATADG